MSTVPVTIQEMVTHDYNEYVRLSLTIPPDLKAALKSNERIPALFDSLTVQLTNAAKAKPHLITRDVIKKVVYDFTELFITGVKSRAEQRIMSDVDRAAMDAKIKERQSVYESLDKNGNGKLMEGVYVRDKDNQRTTD